MESSESPPSSVEKGEGVHQRGLSQAEFREIYERHATEILRFAIRYTGRREIAEEFASEAFLKMYENRERIEPQRAAGWLTAAVKNLAIDYWRRAETERKYQSVAPEKVELPVDRKWDELLAVPSLKPEHRACLTLHYVHGMERKEITSHTGLTENQVKSSLQYGLKLLRKAFGVKE